MRLISRSERRLSAGSRAHAATVYGAKGAKRAGKAGRAEAQGRVVLVGDAGVARDAAARLGRRVEISACRAADVEGWLGSSATRPGALAVVAPVADPALAELRPNERRPGRPTVAGAVRYSRASRQNESASLGGSRW